MRCLVLTFALATAAAIPAQTVDHPLNVGGEVKPPKIIYQDDPRSTAAVLKKRTSTPTVALIIDEKGMARDVRLIRSSGSASFDQACVEAVGCYWFKPATLRGQPVAVRLNVSISVDPF